jgi:hypothetical protein
VPFIGPLPVFQLCLISRGLSILDATPYVEIGIDVLMDIVRGLIHLLIGVAVAAPASLGARRRPLSVNVLRSCP